MPTRTAWLYVGLPHTGGAALAEAATSPEQMRRASAELLRDHREQGYRRRDVEGAWAAICRRAWREKRTPLLGDDRLCGADDDQIALLLDGLAGLRPRVVLALRDPATLLVEGWRAEVRQGRTPTFAQYAERVLDPDVEHPQAARFRATHDVPAVLDRWVGALGPDRVHAVVLAPDREPVQALRTQLLGLLGAEDPAVLRGPRSAGGDGAAGTAVLRQVNDALKGRLWREERRDLLGAWLPPGAEEADPTGLPLAVVAETTAWAAKWRARVAESGVDVRGDLVELIPAAARPNRPGPDEAPGAAEFDLATHALGEATVEVARLRRRVAELEAHHSRLQHRRSTLRRGVVDLGG